MIQKILLIIVATFALSGCVSPNIGLKTSPHCSFSKLQGHQTTKLKHIIIDYYYDIKGDTIQFNGTILCNREAESYNWGEAEVTLTLWFLDETNTVEVEKKYLSLDNGDWCGENSDPKKFIATYPYAAHYTGVRFGYSVKMRGI